MCLQYYFEWLMFIFGSVQDGLITLSGDALKTHVPLGSSPFLSMSRCRLWRSCVYRGCISFYSTWISAKWELCVASVVTFTR